jgi:hypothetical protein
VWVIVAIPHIVKFNASSAMIIGVWGCAVCLFQFINASSGLALA